MTFDKSTIEINSIKKFLIEFLREEFAKTGFSKGIVGLSGGVDSALVVHLAVEALGKANVLAVLMPYKTSNPQSLSDAKMIVSQLGIKSETIDISAMVDAYIDSRNITDNVRKGNIMARQRMVMLYDISARERALVIGTSNKTEILLGYGTLFGDTACAINPIGDLYKTQVWQLAEAIGVPKKIIEKKPTADLWEGQTDEDELGFSYKDVDQLLYYMIDEHLSDSELVKKGFNKIFIDKVKGMIRQNQFKRSLPVIAKPLDKK
jgi:NAD+ synthase